MEESDKKLTRKISPYKIIYPVIIGLGVVSYMLYREFDLTAFEQISFGWSSVFWLSVAVMCMFIRDLGYVIRIRVLSGDRLSWIKSIRIIFLWEFTSAVTPSAIGGTSLAILFVNKEGIKVGRSSAIVMATSFLDELYFILMFPIILLCVDPSEDAVMFTMLFPISIVVITLSYLSSSLSAILAPLEPFSAMLLSLMRLAPVSAVSLAEKNAEQAIIIMIITSNCISIR